MKVVASKCMSFGLSICAVIDDLPAEDQRIENMKKLIRYGIQESEIIRSKIQIRSSHFSGGGNCEFTRPPNAVGIEVGCSM